jgi:hypothetical protein
MAYVPDIRRPGYGPAWQTKKPDDQRPFTTADGTEYILYVPSTQQFNAYNKSFKEHKDVFDQIKADVKDDATIEKNGDGFPSNWDHFEWAASLSSTLKKLNKTWGVNDKIWIRNKNDDGKKSNVAVLAITPVKTQRNAKRTVKKASASKKVSASKKASAATEEAAASTTATDDDGYIIDADDIEFGPSLPPITQAVFVKTVNGLTYYYYTREDADNNKYFKIENSDDELVNESGKRINPDGTLMKFIRKSDFDKRQQRKRSKRDWAEKAIETRNDVWLDDYDTSPEPSEGFITEDEEEDEEESVEDRDTALARMVEEDARIAEEEARIAEEHARTADKHASIAKEHARIAEKARIEVEKDRKEKERNHKLRTAMRRRAHHAKAAGAEEHASLAKQARIEEPARIAEQARIEEPAHVTEAEAARIAADPRLIEASKDLPAGWKAYISRQHNLVYYYKPPPPGENGEGTRVWKRPEAGGKRTKKRLRRRSTSKQMKKKRTTTRRKMTTTRRK